MSTGSSTGLGIAGRLAAYFSDSKLTPLSLIATFALGAFAILMLPREEEPQIKVPMIDVMVAMPGASAQEVENRVTRPMEKLLWEISGVEYLYSTSSPGRSTVIVRFKVSTEMETALVRLNQKLQGNFDRIPPGVGTPLVKPRSIDDVPVLAVTLHSRTQDQVTLRRLAAQVDDAIKALPDVAETTLTGGLRRTIRVQLDPAALAARGISPTVIASTLRQANQQSQVGSRPFANDELLLESGEFLQTIEEVGAVVVGVFAGRPVYLRDLATIADTGAEPANYVFFGSGVADPLSAPPAATTSFEAAVTLSIAKRPGANAVTVVEKTLARIDQLRGDLLPSDVKITTVRDYGHTAAEKSNELLLHMGIAVFGVALLILLFLGWRESAVVLLAIPSTLALTLLVFYLLGYTLNRITLFALIFSIGILVDDAIVVIENIIRHLRQPTTEPRTLSQIALAAVDEVGNPTILATWAVIAAILPMAFVGGLMGPYMRPIPVGATAAMLFSLVIAFTITPWAAIRVLRRHSRVERDEDPSRAATAQAVAKPALHPAHETAPSDWFTRLYHRVMEPLLDRAPLRWAFLSGVVVLLLASGGLVAFGAVKVKMLPFDNKSEFQIILNSPEGSTLEHTLRIAQEMAASIRGEPEVRDYQIYAGTSAPFNFNGLVRHYFARGGPSMADVQVNLVAKHNRSEQSHSIARRIRPRIAAIAAKYGADVAIAEVPPGPPVLQTLVAEVYGPDEPTRLALASEVRAIFERTAGVVDIDWYVKASQTKLRYRVDQEKAAHHGVTTGTINRSLQLAAEGYPVDLLHLPNEREDVALLLELAPAAKTTPEALTALHVGDDSDRSRPLVPISELVGVERTVGERDLYRKNLKPVTYVTADVAGVVESPAYAMFKMAGEIAKIDARRFGDIQPQLEIFHLNLPFNDQLPSLKWDGEWHITLEVFRDLGLAFAAVLILIAMLMVGWFKSYVTPLVVMAAIPFSLIGILPAHWALGAFFTATSMIGFMAGAGIVVRNSIILVDFIELRRKQGRPLRDAVIEAGAVRFRPMLLTALAVVVGASVILADPIFQGLAISLMFGEIASLLISRMAVPVLYFMTSQRGD
jgi:multidrug efflux pump subunit AcrB